MAAARDGSLLVSLKSLQEDHDTRERRARDEARAALARAEAEQRARVAAERESRRVAEQERARAEELTLEQERARTAAHERAQAAQAVEMDERRALERARATLELRLAEKERALELSELKAQAARFRDRTVAWLSSALSLLVCAGTLGLYYGKLRPERAALDGAQASALAAQERRANEAVGSLGELRRKNDALSSELSTLRDQLRALERAAPAPAAVHGSGHRPLAALTPHHTDHHPCPEPPDPMDPCL